jgi:hypothetical protein
MNKFEEAIQIAKGVTNFLRMKAKYNKHRRAA